MKIFLTSVLLGLILLGAYLYIYLGAFKEVRIQVVQEPPFHIIYKRHVGPYHKLNSVISSVEAWAREHNLPCSQTFGEYLDHPDKVSHERLRSHGGCLTPTQISASLPANFYQRTVEATPCLEATFSGSPSIGPFVVYPKIQRFASKNRLKLQEKSFEIYEAQGLHNIRTRYLIPLAN